MNNNQLTKCAKCQESFDSRVKIPKQLPCRHTYCPRCLSALVRGPSSIDCDLCRVNHNISPQNVPVNSQVMQLLNGPQVNRNPIQPSIPAPQVYPNAPSFSGANANFNNVVPSINNPSYNSNSQSGGWNETAYLKRIFDDIDHNHDGRISGQELHGALRKGQENQEFDAHTVGALLKKYDTNNDNEINFNEFHSLFSEINRFYNEFLDIDLDMSGSIDSRELASALHRKGYGFSQDFFNWLFFELSKTTGRQAISFDIYVRVITKFDKMRTDFKNMPQNRNSPNINIGQLEQFVRQYFFLI